MKKPIDPNLQGFDDDNLPIDLEIKNPEESEFTEEYKNTDFSSDFYPAPKRTDEKEDINLNLNVEKREHHHHSSHSSGSSHHSHSSHSSKNKKKKMPVAAKIAIAILVILLLLIFVVVGTIVFLESRGKEDMKNVKTETDYQEVIEYNGHKYIYNNNIITVAFIGVDKRELGLENGKVGTAGQADANIVLAVDTSTGKSTAIAVPRDTMVEVDLYSESGLFLRSEEMQLCLSYAYGNGTDTSAANVTTSVSRILYNVPISKYFALDLDGIAPINDAIGGVTVTSLYDLEKYGISKGDEVHLQGDLTEAYVRTRDFNDVNASLNRTARQMQYIKAFAGQLVPAVANDFSVVSNLYNTASEYSSTDISLSNVTYLASLLLSKGVTDFETITLEGEMKPSDNTEYADVVYAEFYPDEDALMETVLSVFYNQAD